MGTIFNTGMAFGVIVTAAVATSELAVRDHAGRSISVTPANAGAGRLSYTLKGTGAASCLVTRGAEIADGSSDLVVSKTCDALLPGLSKARVWIVGDDGTVAFRTPFEETVARFAFADGVDYESFQPRLPLLTLAEVD